MGEKGNKRMDVKNKGETRKKKLGDFKWMTQNRKERERERKGR